MIRSRIAIGLALMLTLALAGCGGGGDGGDEREAAAKAVEGTFVGKVSATKAFVAVVASPVAGKQEKREISVYVADGRRLSEWFLASVTGNDFEASSGDRGAKVAGKLSSKAVTGTLELPGGKKHRFQAGPATGAAGLYELTVSRKGRLSGASAAGIGLKGETPFTRGTGTLKLADGTKHEFAVTGSDVGEAAGLRAGQVRLIVLGGGQLTGAGLPRASENGFLIRSDG